MTAILITIAFSAALGIYAVRRQAAKDDRRDREVRHAIVETMRESADPYMAEAVREVEEWLNPPPPNPSSKAAEVLRRHQRELERSEADVEHQETAELQRRWLRDVH